MPTTDLSGKQSKLASQGKNYCSGQCLLVFPLPYCPCTYDGDPSCRYYRGAVAIYEGKVCCVKEIQFGCSPYGCCYCVSWPIYSTYITGPAGHLLATTGLPSFSVLQLSSAAPVKCENQSLWPEMNFLQRRSSSAV